MKAFKKGPFGVLRSALVYALAVAIAVVGLPLNASADIPSSVWGDISKAEPAGINLAADDLDVAIVIKQIGTQATGTIEVSSTNLLFTTNGTTADSDVAAASGDCGAAAGTLDTGETACDTLGELVDQINESTYWRAAIVAGLRTDVTDGRLLTKAEGSASGKNGYTVLWDTSTAFEATLAVIPTNPQGWPWFAANNAGDLNPNPFSMSRGVCYAINATSTYGSGTSNIELYSVKVTNQVGVGAETVTTLLSEPGGATTANKVFVIPAYGYAGKRGEKLVVRIKNSAAASSIKLSTYCLWIPLSN